MVLVQSGALMEEVHSLSDRLDVHLIGSMPPPFGGVSVHVARLRQRLLEDGHSCTVWCDREDPKSGLKSFGSTHRAVRALAALEHDPILHFHSGYLAAGFLASRGRRVVATFHGPRITERTQGGRFPRQWIGRKLTGRLLRRIPQAIAVSEQARKALLEAHLPSTAISVVNAFLPPTDQEHAHPDNLEALAGFRSRYDYLATANAWAPRFFGGTDLYGLDLCVGMLERLRDRWPKLGLVLAVPQGRGNEYILQLQERVAGMGLTERVLWLFESGAYHPILRECDIFLRPTNTDGFAISVVEAFEFGIPVVASDAVERPEGCLQFRSRNLSDLCDKVDEVLGNRSYWKERSLESKEQDHYSEILKVYRRFQIANGQ